MKKRVEIISGNFSPAGNYSGYDAEGERYFVHKQLMANNGWSKDSDVQFPFYAIAGVKQIGQLDENNEPIVDTNGQAVKVDRMQVLSIFKTREQLIASVVNKATLDIEITQQISEKARTAGLSAKTVDELAALSL